ncbi:hypothetical protein [Uliginosibacterium sp. H1]|uniref:hypothetical protein n=1 Tax=Uliginosibacterium sp. H1 TaxID=3114757 RepID=UPI002E17D639|nr:hypothetical protein [Uliginosibacterium sp. H1]
MSSPAWPEARTAPTAPIPYLATGHGGEGSLVDTILAVHAEALGPDMRGYRNHIHRVLAFYQALSPDGEAPPAAVLIAAAFHDIGIWTDQTFDYLAPSAARAQHYLQQHGLAAELGAQVHALIVHHHKLRPFVDDAPWAASVERWRRADLVDLSLGLIRSGLSRAQVSAIRERFPDAGFHRRLAVLTLRQFCRTPWRPLPMLRW